MTITSASEGDFTLTAQAAGVTLPALSDEYAVNVEKLVAAWLAPLRRTGAAYKSGDPLPFTLVTRVAGPEDLCLRLDNPVVSVHTLCDKTAGYAAAANEAELTHRRMLLLGRDLDPMNSLILPDGSHACVDYLTVFQHPMWLDYEDVMILRQVARYTIGLSYIRVG